MKIVDLTESYQKYYLDKKNLTSYLKTYPTLFDHYFNYWAKKEKFYPFLNSQAIRLRLKYLYAALPQVEQKIENFLDLSLKDLKIIFFVGLNKTNGHAFEENKRKFTVWIPIESYTSRMRAEVFLTHEIIHALHYSLAPQFYFHNKKEMGRVGNCLITEGVAIFLTVKILRIDIKKALFADYLSTGEADFLMTDFKKHQKEILIYIAENFNKNDSKGLFFAKDARSIWLYQGGYLAGYKIIMKISQKYKISPQQILKTPYHKLLGLVKNELGI